MINKIIKALEAENITTWAVNETRSESVEVFFVKKNMDLKRRTDLTDWSVSVYRTVETEGGRLLGSSSVPVYPGMDDAELRRTLREAYFAASFAGNRYYDLIEGKKEPHEPSKSAFSKMTCEEAARVMGEALFASDTESGVFVNSAEIFAIKRSCRVLNSRGVDVSWDACEVRGEYVVQCVEGHDVETYHSFAYGEPNTAELRRDVEKSLRETRDRAAAAKPPKAGTYRVILTGDHVEELLSYYVSRSGAGMVYQHYSDYKPGDPVQGADIRGDKLTIELVGVEPFDSEGIRLTDRTLMENGTLKLLHGGARFASYLGIEPTGSYRAIRVPTGSTPFEEMKREPYLRVVTFSDFQMDPMSGHFAGEIRLAYLYDGETVTPVTGGSVNGSLLAAQTDLTFSRERHVTQTYTGPLAVSIPNVSVAGA